MVRLTVHKTRSRPRRSVAGWRDGAFQALAGRRCGASRRSTVSSPPEWKTSLRCTRRLRTPDAPSSVRRDPRPADRRGSSRAAEPGKRGAYDYEYVRNGTANVFMFVDVQSAVAPCQGDRPRRAPRLRRLHEGPRSTFTTLRLSGSGSSSIISQRTPPARSTRIPCREARRILDRIEFTTRPSTPVGSTWSRSKSG